MSRNKLKADVFLDYKGEHFHVLHIIKSENAQHERLLKFKFTPGKGGVYSDGSQSAGRLMKSGQRDVLHDGIYNIQELTYHERGQLAWKWPTYGLYRSGSATKFDQFPEINKIGPPFWFAETIIWNPLSLALATILDSENEMRIEASSFPLVVRFFLGSKEYEASMIKLGAEVVEIIPGVCFFVGGFYAAVPTPLVSTPVGVFEQNTAVVSTFVAPNFINLEQLSAC